MNQYSIDCRDTQMNAVSERTRKTDWERAGVVYARVALGAAFLSAVASRFGLWDKALDLKHFANFIEYTAEVNSFLPRAVIPYVAVVATVCEMSLGILLILGLWPRWVSLASAALLAMFGTAMAISFGLKSPMGYSVFSAKAESSFIWSSPTRRFNTLAVWLLFGAVTHWRRNLTASGRQIPDA
jgi:putative oxidoreductase